MSVSFTIPGDPQALRGRPRLPPGPRACTKCGETKPPTEFHQRGERCKDGSPRFRSACKACWVSSYTSASARKHKLLVRYGLTFEDYDAMEAAQNGVCAICENACTSGNQLAVDHCHETGEVRALLCSRCNLALGRFQDDPEVFRAAADYLEHHRAT